MNLCFTNLIPSRELSKTLLQHFNVSQFKSDKDILEDQAEKNLIAIKVESEKDIKKIAPIRKAYPLAWIAVVVKRSQLKPSFHSKLLNLSEKNDVWFFEEWEASVWFNLERWFQQQKLIVDNDKIKKELKKLSIKTSALIQRFEYNLRVTENIQRSLVQTSTSSLSGINISAKYIPAMGKGGDYYDFFEYPDKKRVGIILADASTHSMAAALLSVLFKLKLEDFTSRFQTSRAFVSHLCEELVLNKAKSLAPMSLFYGILDRSKLTLDFTSAGNLSPLIWRSNKAVPYPQTKGPEMGTCANFPYREVKVNLHPGDVLFLHTDGLIPPLMQSNKNVSDKLTNLLKSNSDKDPSALRNDLLGIIDLYKSKKPLKDDLTFLNISIDERAMYLAR